MQFLAYHDDQMEDEFIVFPAEVIMAVVNGNPTRFIPNVNCQIWQAAIS